MLLPLKEKLCRTDRLIDQIVYKLYGLTEEKSKSILRANTFALLFFISDIFNKSHEAACYDCEEPG